MSMTHYMQEALGDALRAAKEQCGVIKPKVGDKLPVEPGDPGGCPACGHDTAREQGIKIKRLIGYDAGPKDSCRGGGMLEDSDKFEYVYPLRDWGWDREECERQIAGAGLPVPPKSACFFCPSMQKEEVRKLAATHPDLLRQAIAMEDKAQPNLTAIKGLWRNGVKGTRKPESKRPGRWREFVEQEGLLEL